MRDGLIRSSVNDDRAGVIKKGNTRKREPVRRLDREVRLGVTYLAPGHRVCASFQKSNHSLHVPVLGRVNDGLIEGWVFRAW